MTPLWLVMTCAPPVFPRPPPSSVVSNSLDSAPVPRSHKAATVMTRAQACSPACRPARSRGAAQAMEASESAAIAGDAQLCGFQRTCCLNRQRALPPLALSRLRRRLPAGRAPGCEKRQRSRRVGSLSRACRLTPSADLGRRRRAEQRRGCGRRHGGLYGAAAASLFFHVAPLRSARRARSPARLPQP